jgi:hypothetical protein
MRARDFDRRLGAIRYRPLPGFWASNYRCGLHSGFPKCCIRFFVPSWMLGSHEQIRVHATKLVSSAARMGKWWGYIPCPECCLKEEPIEVLPCPEGSHATYSCGAYTAAQFRHRRRGFVPKRARRPQK